MTDEAGASGSGGHASGNSTPGLVKLNIGGKKFVTYATTLLSCGSSCTPSLLNGGIPSLKDDKGYYFVDRDGKYFEPILEYLRTGYLNIPAGLSKDAVFREADFYSIDIPKAKNAHPVRIASFGSPVVTDAYSQSTLTEGLFISDKYKENEVVLFGDDNLGFVIRGGSSKVEFSYSFKEGDSVEIVWQPGEKNIKESKSERRLTNSDKGKDKNEGDTSPKRNIWFLQGSSLITSAANVYTFVPQIPHVLPGSVYINLKSPLGIYDTGQIFGFRFPTVEEIRSTQLESREQRGWADWDFQDMPGMQGAPIAASSSSKSTPNFLYCDVRNQWAKCPYIRSKFCNNLDSLLIRYKSTDPIRHKSYLSYYNHEYEMCYETFTIELLVFSKLLLARLVSYNLVRKDRSVIPVQFTTSFISYKKGLFVEKEADKPSSSDSSSSAKSD